MKESQPASNRLDLSSFEMIFIAALISLHDFLLSDALSVPIILKQSTLLQLRSLDRVVSGLEYLVPIVVFAALILLFLMRRNDWVRNLTMAYLGWVTLRLVAKVMLVLFLIIVRQKLVLLNVLLKDTVVLWFVNMLLFSVWYWIIDWGGPRARREGTGRRYDFAFPQQVAIIPGWNDWQPGFWDYVFLGFCGSTQFGFSDAFPLTLRAKFLLMLQATLSILVIVFIASIAAGAIH
jgi:hypothetical protein